MNFLQYTTDALIQKGWDDLKNYTLVFPMQRAGLYAKMYMSQALAASGYNKPVVLPRMLTIDQLVDDLSELRTVDEIRAVCQLYDIYCSTTSDQITLDAFFGWGSQLLKDFSAIDMSLLDLKGMVSNMAESQALDITELDDETRENLTHLLALKPADESINAFFRHLWEVLPDICKNFNEQMQAAGVGTKGQCYRWVIDHFSDLLPKLENRTYVFVGFNYLLPAERRIMELLRDRKQALFFWDNDPSFTLDDNVYKYVRENAADDAFPNEYNPESKKEKKHITAIATTSSNAQAQYVCQWLKDTHKPGQRTAVVIADETMLESVLYALPADFSKKVNITKGYPLKHTHVYADLVKYLSDTANDRQPGETNYAAVLQRLIAHLDKPKLAADAETGTWQDILQAEAYCQTILVINRFIALIGEGVLAKVTELRTLRNLLRRTLDSVSLPFHGEPLEEVQIIGVLETRLLDFDNVLILNVEEGVVPGTSADRCFIPFDLRKAYKMQTREEEARVYAYNFFRVLRRASNVTLMFSEATGETSKKTMSRFLMQMLVSSDFEVTKLRIAESTQASAPAVIIPNKRWIDTAAELTCNMPDGTQRKEKMLSLSPSALSDYIECPREFYLKHIEHVQEAEGQTLIFAPNELGSLFHGAIEYAYKAICNGGNKIEELTPVDPKKVADFLHPDNWEKNSEAAIDAGYKEMVDNYDRHHKPKKAAAADGEQDGTAAAASATDAKSAGKTGKDIYKKDLHKAENEVVRTLLRNVLEDDAKRLSGLQIRCLEGDFRRLIKQDDWELPVRVGGVIDRLDVVTENGKSYLRVLDYKSGSYDAKKMEADSLDTIFSEPKVHYVLQTLLYSSVCHDWQKALNPDKLPVMSQLMFVQKLSADRHVKLAKEPVTDFAGRMLDVTVQDPATGEVKTEKVSLSDEFNRRLNQKISEILADEKFEQCPEGKCGSYCPFYVLCGREKKEW